MIYLDNSATTQVCLAAIEQMEKCMREAYYNPSALYGPSLEVRNGMNRLREEILRQVRCPGGRVVFVSGGTEADNLAVLGGTASFRDGRILCFSGEHPAVKEACRAVRGLRCEMIPMAKDGTVDLKALEEMLDASVRLIAVMQVNNETGAVQPLREIGALRDRRCPQAVFHVDGVQGFLRVPMDMKACSADTYALSSHKIHGPKGCGALVLRQGAKLSPIVFGGGQEGALRSGTENVPGIMGMGAAIRCWQGTERMRELKETLYRGLMEAGLDVKVNGPDPLSPAAAPHILNISLMPVRSETMLHALEGEGILIGIGSACASNKQRISETLKAMGVPREQAECALRFSLSPMTTEEEIRTVIDAVRRQYALLSPYHRR